MIVLDEHLQDTEVGRSIGRWYRGRVCTITDLRPNTGIKDDAIPQLLRTAVQPTFVTLNWMDFWERTVPSQRFCVVCMTLPTKRVAEVSSVLRRLFRLSLFKTKAARMGKIARISGEQVAYYQAHDVRRYMLALP